MKPYQVLLPLLLFVSSCLCRAQDLQQPFKDCQLEGSITVYDYHQKRWLYSDSADAHRASLPASTFKIPHSLIALETGAVKDEHEVFPWDGTPREVAAWNGDTDMKNAFANSTVWFYVRLAERLGNSTYRRYFKRMNYGNGKMAKAQGADFWNYGDFAVSPREQILFLQKLHEGKLPFKQQNLQKVKQFMVVEQTPAYTLRAKTGWTKYNNVDSGWWVGYVETRGNVFFFATRLHKPRSTVHPHFSDCRKTITRKVLHQLGVLPSA
ncbi:class D beta-lactamase [Rufibacter quisquiliarum]|uniref:Beta-lactamase n=1 Tax=Rufibacter quisquiliarum TaxID=1549639 RepID=A0A839GQS1_9BACT|nr:class D beta-lactamase [Rufibacter quisquiliarum]MBA9076758.1 beta-lactamase class D [Rufibacter quisquiliarum]